MKSRKEGVAASGTGASMAEVRSCKTLDMIFNLHCLGEWFVWTFDEEDS